jgi:hypothetical protein
MYQKIIRGRVRKYENNLKGYEEILNSSYGNLREVIPRSRY